MAERTPLSRFRSPLLRCYGFYRPHARILAAALAVGLVTNVLMPLPGLLLGKAINALIGASRAPGGSEAITGLAFWWALALLGLAAGRGLVQYFGTILFMQAGQRLLHDMRLAIFTQIQRLDLAWHLRHGSGEIVNRTTRDSDKVRDAVTGGLRSLVEIAVLFAAVLVLLACIHPLLGIIPAVLVLLGLWLVVRQAGTMAAHDRASGDAYDAVIQDLDEGVRGVRVVKSFALETNRSRRFAGNIDGFSRLCREAVDYVSLHLPLPQLVVALAHVWILVFGAWLVTAGRMQIGDLVGSMLMMQMIIFRIESVGSLQQLFAEAAASAGRIWEILDAKPAIVDGARTLPPGPLGLRLRAVRVRTPHGKVVLDGLDLTLAPGEILALVGATGSGKSTLAALIPRLSDPEAGRIELGSAALGWIDVRELPLAQVRRRVQMVFQDPFLFSDSLVGNLRRNQRDADEARIHAVLDDAAASEVVTGLPQGLASPIGERGVTLSGGQRQRLCLARALIAKPDLIVLDDATSALDAVTEGRILDRLRASAHRPGMLIIAGKLSSILLADRVALLGDDGRIAATGTHEHLVANCPAYRDLLGLETA